MSAYATVQSFDGRRAFVTARVLVKLRVPSPVSGTVVSIDEQRDAPVLALDGRPEILPLSSLPFVAIRDEADVARMPAMSWAWPPRL